MRRSMKETGFTLIELMITVAIIGILSAFALPSYSNYIAAGRVQTAQSDVQTLANVIDSIYTRTLSYPSSISNVDSEAQITASAVFPDWNSASGNDFVFKVEFASGGYTITATAAHTSLTDCVITFTHEGRETLTDECVFD